MNIEIRILTCDRLRKNPMGVNYVHTTIVNFLSAGGAGDKSVSLYVSHPDIDYVKLYRNQFRLLPADRELTGYENFIRVCTKPTKAELILALEDDLDFSSNFPVVLSAWVEKHQDVFVDNIVSLYTPYTEINQCMIEGKELWRYPTDWFYGTQALLATPKIMHECGASIEKIENMPWDMAIKEWLKDSRKGIISMVPCLVQHIGMVSSVHGQQIHTTVGFVK